MKKAALYLLLATALVSSSCKKTINESESDVEHDLAVHLQHGFDDDQVAVFINGEQKFNDGITSNPALGLATAFDLVENEGVHTIMIKMNNKHTLIKSFPLKKDTWIGVGFNLMNKLEVKFSDQPFIYD